MIVAEDELAAGRKLIDKPEVSSACLCIGTGLRTSISFGSASVVSAIESFLRFQ